MSGFFGIFRPQGGPVDLEAFEQMKTAMQREGFDGMETHVEDKIAMGHLMLRVSPESKYDKQPLKSSCGNYLLVGHFRLDYRDELGDKLGLTQAELEVTPDSQLAMLAYQRWKEKCVHHLEGDWAFLVYDYKKDLVFIAKDPFGYSAIFFRKYKDQFYFSSMTDCLLGISLFENEINFNQFFRQSIVNVGPSLSETLVKDLYSMECGNFLLVDSKLNENKIKFFGMQKIRSIKYRFELDYSFTLSSFFSLSVKSKLSQIKSVGLFLSGGLDSTGVAHFASKELAFCGEELHSYTSFPYYLSEISEKHLLVANEVPLVKSFIKTHNNIIANFCNFPDSLISELLLSDYVGDAFNPIVNPNIFWIDGILSEMEERGIAVALNGQLGNFTLTPSAPFIHAEMFLGLKFVSLIRELMAISIRDSKSFIFTFRDRVLSPLKFQFKSLVRYIFFYFTNSHIKNLIFDSTSTFFKSFKTFNHIENLPNFSFVSSSRKLRLMQVLSVSGIGGKMWYREAEKKRLQVSDPTSDCRLILFSFSIPEKEYNKRGNYKAVYKNMMSNRLPCGVLQNPHKMMQSFDIHERFKNDHRLKNILISINIKSSQISFVKIEKLNKLYDSIMKAKNQTLPYTQILIFLNTISLILFYFRIKRIALHK